MNMIADIAASLRPVSLADALRAAATARAEADALYSAGDMPEGHPWHAASDRALATATAARLALTDAGIDPDMLGAAL